MTVKIIGPENFRKKLNNFSEKLKQLDGKQEISLKEIMNKEFIEQNSKFSSLENLFQASGFEINSVDDFKKIPDKEWDEFIKNNTTFSDWNNMQNAAMKKWITSKLSF